MIEETVLERIKAVYESSHTYKREKTTDEITLDTEIRKDLEFDSIMLVVLQIDLEDRFHIRFDPVAEDLGKVFTTAKIISQYIKNVLDGSGK